MPEDFTFYHTNMRQIQRELIYRARYISNGFLHFPQNKDNNEALFSQHNIVIINIYFPKWTRK